MKWPSLTVILCLLAAMATGGCGRSPENEIRLGVNAELTGNLPAVGASCKNAMEFLAAQVNRDGGLKLGNKQYLLKLFIEDNGDQPKLAATATRKLINQDHVLAIIGPNASDNATAAAPVCEAAKVVMITPWATNPKVTEGKKYIFRACFIDSFQGQVMAKFARDTLKAQTAAVLYNDSKDVNKVQAEFFKKFFTAGGGKIVAFESYPKGAKDFTSQFTIIKAANPDVLFLPNYYHEIPLQVQQARRLGINCPFIGSDAWGSPELLTLCGVDLDQSYFSTHYSPDLATDTAQKFIRAYAAKYGKIPDDVAALTYDAGCLLLQAIRQAGTPDRQKVRDALAAVQEFAGVTGTMKFHGTGDPIKSAVIIHVKDCKFQYYGTVNP